MTVEDAINISGRDHSPYMGALVNHLPMAQWAAYKLSGQEEVAENFTKEYLHIVHIDRVKEDYEKIESLEEALGHRDLYEGTLDFLRERSLKEDIKDITREILNKYKFGMSSGLFHTLIRVAYGVEGYSEKEKLKEELLRGLAYYITGYRESKLFKREILPDYIFKEMKDLTHDKEIKQILEDYDSLGQRMKTLYKDRDYIEKAFIIQGNSHAKIITLLKLLAPLFYKKNNIVVLHCITSIHAMVILKDYYDDYEEALDILTSAIVTHLITTSIDEYPQSMDADTGFSWKCLKEKALKSKDVHDIKLTYSTFILDEIYDMEELKDISIKRIRHS